MEIILYTTHCPKCRVLETKFKQKNLTYTEITDINLMKEKGFLSAPMLELKTAGSTSDSTILNFSEAVKWVNSLEEQ